MFQAFRCLLVLSFLSLQLSLMSGGERCPVVSMFSHAGSAMGGMDMGGMDMGGMDMGGMDMGGMEMAAPSETDSSGAPSSDDQQPCDEDDGGSAMCDSMTPCVFAAVVSPSYTATAPHLPSVRAPVLAVRTPPTEGDAPDLPPPRHAS